MKTYYKYAALQQDMSLAAHTILVFFKFETLKKKNKEKTKNNKP